MSEKPQILRSRLWSTPDLEDCARGARSHTARLAHNARNIGVEDTWSRELRAWYVARARGLLARECDLLASDAGVQVRPIEIGVLGLTGVGKSSLLNAMISPGTQLLPAGGVGPLTSIPVQITTSHERTLAVRYRDRTWLHDMMVTLNDPRSPSVEDLGRASLLCTGEQYGSRDPKWLITALRYALRPDLNPAPRQCHDTLDALHSLCLAFQRTGTLAVWNAAVDQGEFFRLIRTHTTGQLAPLCEAVEIEWPSRFLPRAGVLVDLPGLGAIHDAHASQTTDWLGRSRATLLVVDRAGLPEAIVIALQTSGFLERLRAGRAQLAIAITKLDLVADDQRRGWPSRTWAQHYFDACQRATDQMHAQLATQLSQVPGWRDDLALTRRVVSQIKIVPVSSRERHRIQVDDEFERPRLKTPGATGISDLHRAIRAMVRLDDPLARAIDVALCTTPHRGAMGDMQDDWTLFLEREEPA